VDSDDPKILFWEGGVKEEICLPEVPHFLAKVVDFRLYYCILEENAKNSTSGRNQFLNLAMSLRSNPGFREFSP
jgi:hypothetical protein